MEYPQEELSACMERAGMHPACDLRIRADLQDAVRPAAAGLISAQARGLAVRSVRCFLAHPVRLEALRLLGRRRSLRNREGDGALVQAELAEEAEVLLDEAVWNDLLARLRRDRALGARARSSPVQSMASWSPKEGFTFEELS
jgi:hypothetical protein